MIKFIFVTGGVVSSLGKGIASATIGALLQSRGFTISFRKIDPYLNVDPGTMSPVQHGEVFVTDDGYESDMDLGHYERFTGVSSSRYTNITTGKIYSIILEKERRGEFLGKTVQIIPHVTNEIKGFIFKDSDKVDFVICEIGGTVGDIEGQPYYEAIRQIAFELGRESVCFVHLTYLPYVKMAEEIKTKPTQHSVKSLQSLGIQPDILLCRADVDISDIELDKISLMCNIKRKNVIPALNVDNIYKIPLVYHSVHLDDRIIEMFHIPNKELNLAVWNDINNNITFVKHNIRIAIVGKYTSSKESYKSLVEAIKHAGIATSSKIDIVWIESRLIKNKDDLHCLNNVDAVIVPGGFGIDGTEGKILAIQYVRENKIPFLGICLGMQMAIVEFCRNVLRIKNANSTEFDSNCVPVVSLITEWMNNGKIEKRDLNSNLGGTMRLGSYVTNIKKDSLLYGVYKKTSINERHRHRYEFNINYKKQIESAGMIFSGYSPDEKLMECVEITEHPFFIAVQFHPEFKSRPFDPAPLFVELVKSALVYKNKKSY